MLQAQKLREVADSTLRLIAPRMAVVGSEIFTNSLSARRFDTGTGFDVTFNPD
jgi:hypothetical protein